MKFRPELFNLFSVVEPLLNFLQISWDPNHKKSIKTAFALVFLHKNFNLGGDARESLGKIEKATRTDTLTSFDKSLCKLIAIGHSLLKRALIFPVKSQNTIHFLMFKCFPLFLTSRPFFGNQLYEIDGCANGQVVSYSSVTAIFNLSKKSTFWFVVYL